MEKTRTFTLSKINGHEISCMEYIPENAEKILITVHGFSSHRACDTAKLLFEHMPAKGIGVVSYDQPAHGSNESRKEPLIIRECINSLQTVENYVINTYPTLPIIYFSSSFGAYITALYISSGKNNGRKAFFRSAAINIPAIILNTSEGPLDPDYKKTLAQQGYYDVDTLGSDTIRIPAEFLYELAENDLFEKFLYSNHNDIEIEMVHGENDDVIDVRYAREFAEKFGIIIHVIPGEGHTLSDFAETPTQVAELAYAFYNK